MLVYISSKAPVDEVATVYSEDAWRAMLAARGLAEIEAVLRRHPGKPVAATALRPVGQITAGAAGAGARSKAFKMEPASLRTVRGADGRVRQEVQPPRTVIAAGPRRA